MCYSARSEMLLRLNRGEPELDDLPVVIRADPTNAAALCHPRQHLRNSFQGCLPKDDFERACVLGSTSACEELPGAVLSADL